MAAMKIKLDKNAYMPVRAHKMDAGLDIFSPSNFTIRAKGSATVDSGVHVAIPRGYVGFLKSKSGLNVKHGIVSEGVIDAGYTGSIIVKMHNLSDETYYVSQGDKITQLVILPLSPMFDLELVDELDETERGDRGFGSSGK